MNNILETIVSRRSIKKYKNTPVEKELLNKVIKAGTYAPTGKNRQSPLIIAITNTAIRNRLSIELADYRNITTDPFYGAPVILAVLADKGVFTHVYDGSCVIENMLLEAHSLGLGACWIHHAKEIFERDYGKKILARLGLSSDYEGIGFCILGHSDIEIKNEIPRKDNYVYYLD